MYIYKEDLALNNQQWVICSKTNPSRSQTPFPKTITVTLPFYRNVLGFFFQLMYYSSHCIFLFQLFLKFSMSL